MWRYTKNRFVRNNCINICRAETCIYSYVSNGKRGLNVFRRGFVYIRKISRIYGRFAMRDNIFFLKAQLSAFYGWVSLHMLDVLHHVEIQFFEANPSKNLSFRVKNSNFFFKKKFALEYIKNAALKSHWNLKLGLLFFLINLYHNISVVYRPEITKSNNSKRRRLIIQKWVPGFKKARGIVYINPISSDLWLQ